MLKTIDLFAGAGGLSLGFIQTGKFEILAAAEINKNAQETYKRNISKETEDFILIDDVIGCDFKKLSEQLGGIDVVIGGPPCQGFSNANRQKNHLISMNNGLVKEYFRAVKEIKPKAFVMENVSMLRSDKHRFYESAKDNNEIVSLVEKGFNIPKRQDIVIVAENKFEDIDFADISFSKYGIVALPESLIQLMRILLKNSSTEKKLQVYLQKNMNRINKEITEYLSEKVNDDSTITTSLKVRLSKIQKAMEENKVETQIDNLRFIVDLHKCLSTIREIKQNELIGEYVVTENNKLIFKTNSYSVIDYVNAILGGEYVQNGGTLNAEWFGVPQERRRYIVFGIRKDLCGDDTLSLPEVEKNYHKTTVGEAILDLVGCKVGYDTKYPAQKYPSKRGLSKYAKIMRGKCASVPNHIATSTTKLALERFKQIKPGNNFHSLSNEMKTSYTKPERTQNTIYLRLDPSKPSGTVVNVRKSMWIHPTLDRAITVREAARLQSFPDSFEFVGTKDAQYQQVGNAVPPLMAKGIAENILKKLNI